MQVGIAGIGFMGWIHWLAYQQVPGAAVAAICTRSQKKRDGDWTDIKGNFGPPGEVVDLSEVRCHEQLDALLADDRIDLVDICLPPDLHVDAVKACLAAGKHVLCEKPLALNAADCDELLKVVESSGKQLLVAQVLPMLPEYAYALDAVRGGKLGRPLGGVFKRVISDPTWLKDFYDPNKCGGPLIDLHVHDAHFIRLLFGMPTGVSCQGRRRGEVVEYCNTLFHFDDPSLVVSAICGVINQQGRSFTHGYEIHLEKATLNFEFAVVGDQFPSMPLTVLHEDGTVERPTLGDGDMVKAFVAEIEEVHRAISSGEPSTVLSGDLARDAIAICQMQEDAVPKSAGAS